MAINMTPEEEAALKSRIKEGEGNAHSVGVYSSPQTDESNRLENKNVRLSEATHAPYMDIVAMSFKYMPRKDKDGNDLPPRVSPTKENFDADREAVEGVLSATQNYNREKSEANKQALKTALDTLYSRESNVTVGYGHLTDKADFIEDFDRYINLNQDQANEIFEGDYTKKVETAKKFKGFDKAPSQVQQVLIDMSYNMGEKPLRWKNFTKQIAEGRYKDAAKNLRSTAYFRQLPRRAGENVSLLDEAPKQLTDKEVAEAAKKAEEAATLVEPKAPAEKPAPEPIAQKKKPSDSGEPKDYSDYPFKEAFDMAKNRDKQKIFYWEGRPFTTVTADELFAKSAKEEPKLPAKDGGVEDIFGGPIETPAQRASRVGIEKQAAADLEEDIAATEKAFTKPEAKDPFADLGLGEVSRTPDGKSKISNILKKTTSPEYDTMSFDKAFAKAKKKGEKEFTWKGRPYHTKYKEEM